jgi:hypothetical protein
MFTTELWDMHKSIPTKASIAPKRRIAVLLKGERFAEPLAELTVVALCFFFAIIISPLILITFLTRGFPRAYSNIK